jgi:hypothetical protein
MKARVILSFVATLALAVAGCGDDGSGSGGMTGTGGMSGAGGSAGAGGSGGSGGSAGSGGSTGDADCSAICDSPCLEDVLGPGNVDDCLQSCNMGLFPCVPETRAVIECLETIECGMTGSPECIDESAAFTTCITS